MSKNPNRPNRKSMSTPSWVVREEMNDKLDDIKKMLQDKGNSQAQAQAPVTDDDPNTILLKNLIEVANTAPGSRVVGAFLSQMLFQPLWRSVARFLKSIEDPLAEIGRLTDLNSILTKDIKVEKWNNALENFKKSVYVKDGDGYKCQEGEEDPDTGTCYQYELKPNVQGRIKKITDDMNELVDKISAGENKQKMQKLSDEIANYLSRTIAAGSISAIRGFTAAIGLTPLGNLLELVQANSVKNQILLDTEQFMKTIKTDGKSVTDFAKELNKLTPMGQIKPESLTKQTGQSGGGKIKFDDFIIKKNIKHVEKIRNLFKLLSEFIEDTSQIYYTQGKIYSKKNKTRRNKKRKRKKSTKKRALKKRH